MNQRMLIIEDSMDMRAVLEVALAHGSECAVRCAPSRDEALTIIKDGWWPQIILLDYHMPGMSAPRFLSELRDLSGPRPRIILMTADSNGDVVASRLGLREILRKPFDPEKELRSIVPFAASY